MAKTKKQKQDEAIERKRGLFSANFDHYIKHQPGAQNYLEIERMRGIDQAKDMAERSMRTFERFCAEAKIDKHGNPL